MELKRCDRCQKTIEPQKATWLEALATAVTSATKKLAGMPDYKIINGTTGWPADLCPSCHKDLQEWMRNGRPEGKPEGIQKAYIIKDEDVKFGDF